MSQSGCRSYRLRVDGDLLETTCCPAMVWAEGIDPHHPNAESPAFLSGLLERVVSTGEAFVSAERRQRVRKMLRHGKYRPSGRGKPSSEYLLRAALGGVFPTVNAPVDINNAVSLESGFPASIFDAALSGSELLLRRGRQGESFVFNSAGQSIDLEDLLLICRREGEEWLPCGNPVKDAMATKISSGTTDVVAVLYVPADEPPSVAERWASAFADLLKRGCQADSVGYQVLDRIEPDPLLGAIRS